MPYLGLRIVSVLKKGSWMAAVHCILGAESQNSYGASYVVLPTIGDL